MPCRDGAASAQWITSNAELADAVAGWGNVIGLDSEFQRTDTFYPLPGLYQVIAGERIYLLDPLCIDDWSEFVELLENPAVTLIMHACSEDLELLRHHMGAIPTNVFDTQIAHAFLSTSFSVSYANLVAEMLGHELPKHETRSDWLQRPLTEQQLRYASEDVVYLPELYRRLRRGLQLKDREDWFRQLMAERGRFQLNDPDSHYQNNKAAWRLNGEDLAVLQALTAWRERCAMEEDVPRNRVVRDEHLLEFARIDELTIEAVRDVLPKSVARRYGEQLVAEHRQGRELPALQRLAQPLSQAQGELSKKLRKIAKAEAQALEFSPELLSRKRDIEACIRHFKDTGELSDEYSGWREPLVGDAFRLVLEQMQ